MAFTRSFEGLHLKSPPICPGMSYVRILTLLSSNVALKTSLPFLNSINLLTQDRVSQE
jgi:hypothetical protein